MALSSPVACSLSDGHFVEEENDVYALQTPAAAAGRASPVAKSEGVTDANSPFKGSSCPDVEATIHCAEWLSIVGGSSTGDLRIRREESLPVFKRRLLGSLLDFAARELQVQLVVSPMPIENHGAVYPVSLGPAPAPVAPATAPSSSPLVAYVESSLRTGRRTARARIETFLTLKKKKRRRKEAAAVATEVAASAGGDLKAKKRPQTQVIAAAAAGVAAEGLSPQEAKAEAENAAQLSVALAENAIVVLMLVEDHLRLQGQHFVASHSLDVSASLSSLSSSVISHVDSLGKAAGETSDILISKKTSLSSDSGGLSLDVLASMADAKGQISAAVMERLTAAAAAEPYESVRCAFVSYGSCGLDLSQGWVYRSRLWYGVGLPSKTTSFGGGGSGWESWSSALEKDSNGNWIELPLIKKSVAMLQALLLDESGIGGGLGIGGGSGTGMGGMTQLYQLLDSDQPFLCMLRMVLASLREDDIGEDDIFMRSISIREGISEGLNWHAVNTMTSDTPKRIYMVQVWHAVGRDRNPLRKQYLEAILPPFVAILRRWRPLLAGIHELTSLDGQNPLIVDDRALAADALPLELVHYDLCSMYKALLTSKIHSPFSTTTTSTIVVVTTTMRTGGGAPLRKPAGVRPRGPAGVRPCVTRRECALGDPARVPSPWSGGVCLFVDGRTTHVHTRTHVHLTCTRRAFLTVSRAFDSIFGEHVHLTFPNPSASCVVSNASPDIEFWLSGIRIFTVDRPFECHTPARSRLTRGLKPVYLRCLSGGGRVLFPDFCGSPGDFAARGLFKSRYFWVQQMPPTGYPSETKTKAVVPWRFSNSTPSFNDLTGSWVKNHSNALRHLRSVARNLDNNSLSPFEPAIKLIFPTQEFPREDLGERTSLHRSDVVLLHQVNSTGI
ncbi:hypothetical protein Taro_030665 [Colocasia esculenta]|uniref:Uncharacterized protein n=1 Tax=Colocasia esculenta TaxID=4460 RepID=A0A843VN07_COLES|nr:hypothetical protein [Colocasia esculenta]